jgi:hypothetical protein
LRSTKVRSEKATFAERQIVSAWPKSASDHAPVRILADWRGLSRIDAGRVRADYDERFAFRKRSSLPAAWSLIRCL